MAVLTALLLGGRVARAVGAAALFLGLALLALGRTPAVQSTPPPFMYLDPSEAKLSGTAAAPGAEFHVDVLVEGVSDLGAFEFDLNFDRDFFKLGAVEIGPFLGSTNRGVICQKVTSIEGLVSVGCNTEGAAPPGPNGSGVIASIDLIVQRRAAGETLLVLASCDGSDILGKEIAVKSCKRAKIEVNPPTPTPTSTPPTKPRMQKVPALQNVFLTRQGDKIPPTVCIQGADIANVEERLSMPIPNVADPKDPTSPQQLGAFEFEVRYDETKACVEIVPGQAAVGMTCIIEDSRTKPTLEGVARIGCVTPKKLNPPDTTTEAGRHLADILVRPQPDVYSKMRPTQDNGVVVQLNNVGCSLADLQGHAIGVGGCDDADVTFRYLEGDVSPDCLVDAQDAQAIAFRWGLHKGSNAYSEFMNLEPSGTQADNDIDVNDLQFVTGRFNSDCDEPHPPQPPVNPKQGATPTPTPTPTPRPPDAKPRVNVVPPAQELVLNAAPPAQLCEDSPDAISFDFVVKDPIVSPDPKDPSSYQQLGAFEFEVQYPSDWLCVEVLPGDIPQGEMSCLTLGAEGVVRFGCTTSVKEQPPAPEAPGVLAVIVVRPMPDLYSALAPAEKWNLELFIKGCKLSDLLGHTIKSKECSGANVSVHHP
ncbi:MAG: cohesin domain-containing protein [Dehalococcoidia bacterium]